jgi:hypothetical protein
MRDSTAADDGRSWRPRRPVDVFTPDEAAEFARVARLTRSAQREYMAAHIVSEGTAEQQMRELLARILQTGRLAREPGSGTVLRARSHKADGDDAYSFLLDPATRCIVGYRGPVTSWFEKESIVPTENLLRGIEERRREEKEKAERRAAHDQRMREQQEAAARRAREAAAAGGCRHLCFMSDSQ